MNATRLRGQKTGGNPQASKSKIKFDRQIATVAVVEGATAIYSDDTDVRGYAVEAGWKAYGTADLLEPPENPRSSLPLTPPGKPAS